MQAVVANRVVENRAELTVDGFEIGGRVRFTVRLFQVHDFVLPCDDVLRLDGVDRAILEIRQNLQVDHVVLGFPCAFADAHLFVVSVDFNEVRKLHVQVGGALQQKAAFPVQRVAPTGKTAFHFPFLYAAKILVVERNEVGSIGVLVSGHYIASPLSAGASMP